MSYNGPLKYVTTSKNPFLLYVTLKHPHIKLLNKQNIY